jgi:hypothetical protein
LDEDLDKGLDFGFGFGFGFGLGFGIMNRNRNRIEYLLHVSLLLFSPNFYLFIKSIISARVQPSKKRTRRDMEPSTNAPDEAPTTPQREKRAKAATQQQPLNL